MSSSADRLVVVEGQVIGVGVVVWVFHGRIVVLVVDLVNHVKHGWGVPGVSGLAFCGVLA